VCVVSALVIEESIILICRNANMSPIDSFTKDFTLTEQEAEQFARLVEERTGVPFLEWLYGEALEVVDEDAIDVANGKGANQ